MKEIWKPCIELESLYEVSNLGRIRSLQRKYIVKKKILKGGVTEKGYRIVSVLIDGKQKSVYLHRLVANTFIDNFSKKPQVNHIDSNRLNNNIKNLEWVTNKENSEHAVSKGRIPNKETHYNAKLSRKDVEYIRKCNISVPVLAKKYSVARETIRSIIINKNWKDNHNKE